MSFRQYSFATQHAVYTLCEDPDIERAAVDIAGQGNLSVFAIWAHSALRDSGCAFRLDDVDFEQVMELMRQ
jgi:hypothetical protein